MSEDILFLTKTINVKKVKDYFILFFRGKDESIGKIAMTKLRDWLDEQLGESLHKCVKCDQNCKLCDQERELLDRQQREELSIKEIIRKLREMKFDTNMFDGHEEVTRQDVETTISQYHHRLIDYLEELD